MSSTREGLYTLRLKEKKRAAACKAKTQSQRIVPETPAEEKHNFPLLQTHQPLYPATAGRQDRRENNLEPIGPAVTTDIRVCEGHEMRRAHWLQGKAATPAAAAPYRCLCNPRVSRTEVGVVITDEGGTSCACPGPQRANKLDLYTSYMSAGGGGAYDCLRQGHLLS